MHLETVLPNQYSIELILDGLEEFHSWQSILGFECVTGGVLVVFEPLKRLLSLEFPQKNRLQISLSQPLAPYPTLFQDADSGNFHLLLVTLSGTFVRLVLSSDLSQSVVETHALDLIKDVVIAHAVDLDTLVLGARDGRLVQLDCPRKWSEDGIPSKSLILNRSFNGIPGT